jgi:NAD(P)-dependent dehydrogenase (short-subunit alcohol dehydrogenase family)
MSPQTRPRALVTGISRGIGRAIATRLLNDGWEVEGTFRQERRGAEALAERFPSLRIHQADFSNEDAVEELLSAIDGRPLSGLVNNAGVIHFEDLQSFDPARWRETLEVNLTAPVLLSRALEPWLHGGVVVNIASTDGLTGSYNSIAYGVSKAALLNATKSLANLLARSDIRVVAVSPGWIETEMTSESELASSLTPLKRTGAPEEVASAVAWLLSSEAAFVTGANLIIDGGYENVDYVILKEAESEMENDKD